MGVSVAVQASYIQANLKGVDLVDVRGAFKF